MNEKPSDNENLCVHMCMLLTYRKLHQLQCVFSWHLEAIGEKKHAADFKCFGECGFGRLLVLTSWIAVENVPWQGVMQLSNGINCQTMICFLKLSFAVFVLPKFSPPSLRKKLFFNYALTFRITINAWQVLAGFWHCQSSAVIQWECPWFHRCDFRVIPKDWDSWTHDGVSQDLPQADYVPLTVQLETGYISPHICPWIMNCITEIKNWNITNFKWKWKKFSQ